MPTPTTELWPIDRIDVGDVSRQISALDTYIAHRTISLDAIQKQIDEERMVIEEKKKELQGLRDQIRNELNRLNSLQ